MSAVIKYDRPVADFIDGLSATGHVTHTKWDKTCVTFHHNGGRLSHQGCLDVWKVRPASAHFDVDANGAVAQYVNVNEYAWACGNTLGNQRSISIEMCNLTLAPDWIVSETTWKSAARLAGWLFAFVIKKPPTTSNVLFHHNWLNTQCAGPYMDSIYSRLLAEVQAAYKMFTEPVMPPAPTGLIVDGYLGPATIKRAQLVMGTEPDGVISPTKSKLVAAIQTFLNSKGCKGYNGKPLVVDGVGLYDNTGGETAKSHTQYALQAYLKTTPRDGVLGSPSNVVKAFQRALNVATPGAKKF